MSKSNSGQSSVTVLKPAGGWEIIDFKELLEYKDLFLFMVWRDLKVLYAQTILGFGWALLQPLIQIIIFTVIFGKIAKIPTEGVPYFLFTTLAIIPWTYMSSAMTSSSQSLISGQSMLGKIYFPRLIFPITPILTKLVDFTLSLVIILATLLFYQITPTWNMLLLPFFIIYMMCVPAGIGLWLSSLAIRYRDVNFAMSFIIRMLMYTAPIVYSVSTIPEAYRFIYSLNPIVGVIEGFRACLLGTAIPWEFILPSFIVALLLLVSGALYFRKMESIIVDVI